VGLFGEVDIAVAPALSETLHELLRASDVRLVVVDLRGLTFMDAASLAPLVSAERRASRYETALWIVKPPLIVQRIFEVTGLDRYLPMVDTLEEVPDYSRSDSREQR
jgi:anti-sigma B factor antagonist